MKILLIGCGKMGSALYKGWLKSGVTKSDIVIVDPLSELANHKDLSELPTEYEPEYVILAVKPQNLDEVLAQLNKFSGAVFVSIIAGKTINQISAGLGNSLIVRTMPNLPATIGKGVIAAVANRKIQAQEANVINQILGAAGKLVWLDNENDIDAVTAVSGSGPAYVFLFAESMIEAAVKLGLKAEVAKLLVFETLKGSVDLAQASNDDLNQLKVNVTSKGGTTEAALKVLESDNVFKKLINDAVKEAHLRAKELAK